MEIAVAAGKRETYPALSSLRRRKKSRDYVDYDYVQKLSPAERAYLEQFTDEYYNANGRRYDAPLLDVAAMDRKNYTARSDLMNEWQRIDGASPPVPIGELEDALAEAVDARCPVVGDRRAFPVPATRAPPGMTGPGGASRCPAIEKTNSPTPNRTGNGSHKTPYLTQDWRPEVSKVSHAKKRAAKKLKAVPPPSQATIGSGAGAMFRQVAGLLKCGLHTGQNARAVAQAIELMEQSAVAADAHPPMDVPTPPAAELTEAGDGQESA